MAEKKDPGGVIDDAARLVGKNTREERAGGASAGGGWRAETEEKAPMGKEAKAQGGMGHRLYEAIVHKGGERLRKFMGEGKHPRS